MRQPTPPARDYQPDPFELQIGSMVVFHRATLLHHDRATHDALIQVSNDYLWYGQYLEKLTGATPPWDPTARNEATPPLLFLETEEWIGHTQSIPKPSFGGVHRHFRLVRRADADKGLFRPTPEMAHALAVVELIQHPDKRWQVLHAEDQRGPPPTRHRDDALRPHRDPSRHASSSPRAGCLTTPTSSGSGATPRSCSGTASTNCLACGLARRRSSISWSLPKRS